VNLPDPADIARDMALAFIARTDVNWHNGAPSPFPDVLVIEVRFTVDVRGPTGR
jgi:hypothetical protein